MVERVPGTAARPRLFLHPALLLLALAALFTGWGPELAVVFGSVLLHELAHMGIAAACGLRPARVTLYPFGGVAELPGLAAVSPRVRLLVLAAGPAANLLVLVGSLAWAGPEGAAPAWGATLVRANLGLLTANLLPLGPLDGGRMAEMILERWMGTGRARRLLLSAGTAAGVVFSAAGAFGLATGRPWASLALFGPFLVVASGRERSGTLLEVLRRSLSGPRRPRVGSARLLAAPVDARVRDVAPSLGPGAYRVVAVVEPGGRVRGVLGEGQIDDALARGGGEATLGDLLAAGCQGDDPPAGPAPSRGPTLLPGPSPPPRRRRPPERPT